ncbi:MAG: HEPN domain-containing protein [Candidatus Altiarchaeota archaeon]|nr:HEPN domain-containing protein [Candidatus Altiarchaeota archaeon]
MAKRAFDFKECMKLGLLKEVPPSPENAARSMSTARDWLGEAGRNMDARAYNSCILSSYAAMFHSARAILFLDGFREKSHACIARYLEAKYVKKGLLEKGWVDLLDRYRDLRHDGQYGIIRTINEKDAEDALDTATDFVKRMGKLLDTLRM